MCKFLPNLEKKKVSFENSQKAIEFGLKIYHEHFQDNSKHEKLEKLFREMVEHNQLSTDF